jgi:hypothetical protein
MAPRTPDLPADFVELLAAFDRADVRYLVIGGYAVGYHDRPRTTKDLDLLLDAAPHNMRRVCEALTAFGAPPSVAEDLLVAAADEIVWFGGPPLRVDFLKQASGIDFPDIWSRRVIDRWNGVPVSIVSRDDLVRIKRAAGPEQDLIDARNLERSRPDGG